MGPSRFTSTRGDEVLKALYKSPTYSMTREEIQKLLEKNHHHLTQGILDQIILLLCQGRCERVVKDSTEIIQLERFDGVWLRPSGPPLPPLLESDGSGCESDARPYARRCDRR